MNDVSPIPSPELPPTDPLEGEPELRKELAGLFLIDYPEKLARIRQFITDRNAPDLRSESHALKGSAGVFRDQAAFGAAFQMEMVGRDAAWDRAEATWKTLQAEIRRLAGALTQFVAQTAPSAVMPALSP